MAMTAQFTKAERRQMRALWSTYQGLSDVVVLERGVGLGFIEESA